MDRNYSEKILNQARAEDEERDEQERLYVQHQEEIFEQPTVIDTETNGEEELLDEFRKLYSHGLLTDTIVYYQLKLSIEDEERIIDMLMVSPKGIYVIETKHWGGTTYIDYCRPFRDEMFMDIDHPDFGKGSKGISKQIRVFNVKSFRDEDNGHEKLIFNGYEHPINQARKYSTGLRRFLDVPRVNNVVVFTPTKGKCEVRYNNALLENPKPIDSYTTIITKKMLGRFISEMDHINPPINVKDITKKIDSEPLLSTYRLDKDNYEDIIFFCHRRLLYAGLS
jgi:hypothetical protein